MYGRWSNIAVVVFWLSMMSWLFWTKLFPSWWIGNPPDSQRVLEVQREEPLVAWTIRWNERELGWAISQTKSLPHELTWTRSIVRFEQFPLSELAPQQLRNFVPGLEAIDGKWKMQVETELDFDALGKLSRFDTAVGFPQAKESMLAPGKAVVRIRGVTDWTKLRLWIRYRDEKPLETEVALPREAMLRDAISPQSHLPDLKAGQAWTIETYNPLLVPGDPKEILHAEVQGREPLWWDQRQVDTWVVVYHSDPGTSLSREGALRGRMWVTRQGRVLQQQVMIFHSSLTFRRLPDHQALELAAQILPPPSESQP